MTCPCTECKKKKEGCSERCYPFRDYQRAIRRRRRNAENDSNRRIGRA